MVRKHKKENDIPFDDKILQFNNLYIKRNLKRICSSKKYKELKAKYGNHFTPVKIVNDDVDKMVKHLLKYSYGAQFLEDYFLTDYNFKNELLIRGEIESPFAYIKVEWTFKDILKLIQIMNYRVNKGCIVFQYRVSNRRISAVIVGETRCFRMCREAKIFSPNVNY